MANSIPSLREIWESYRTEVLDKNAGVREIQMAFQAFFAGATITLELLTAAGALPEEAADREVDRIELEIRSFLAFAKGMGNASRN